MAKMQTVLLVKGGSRLNLNCVQRVRRACLEITGGQFNVRVLLSDLRQHLADLPREVVDETLIAMQRSQELALMPLDDPQSIKPADEQAAIDIGGNKRHIVYLEP